MTRTLGRRIGVAIGWVADGLVIAVATAWGALVLYYLGPGSSGARQAQAWGFAALGLATLGSMVLRRARRLGIPVLALAFALVLVVWGSATATNNRDWQPEVAVLDYMLNINELRDHPRFYNTLTTNCTTMILAHAAVNPGVIPYSWKVLLSGYAPEYAYDRGRLVHSMPLGELRRRSHVNAAAQAADDAPDFSRRIRTGLP
jgi:hypothetical protein